MMLGKAGGLLRLFYFPEMLSARSLTMEYPGVKALSGVDFDLRAGEIHALCGENGAGKSTLIKILSGILPHGRYGGAVTLGGREARFAGPADALRAGIRVIHQELALCPDFTVAQNVFLGAEPLRYGCLDETRMGEETRRELAKRGIPGLDPNARVNRLPVGLRQMVEITRSLRAPADGARAARVLILDEPTSALSAPEADNLERTLRGLREEGYAILYISHRLDEVFRLADRITVLRNGESAGTIERSIGNGMDATGQGFDATAIISRMVGRTLQSASGVTAAPAIPPEPENPAVPPLLSVRHWSVPAPGGARNLVDDVSFDLYPGEILGVAGLMGAGRTELVESLCGLLPGPPDGAGTVHIGGLPYRPRDARQAHAHGLALVSEDRRNHGILPERSVRANLSASALRDFCFNRAGILGLPFSGWLLREDREGAAVRERMQALRVKAPDPEFSISHLSGGNQQKVLVGRALMTHPRILILDEPTRGIDVGAKEEIYGLVRDLAAQGMAVILVSSENEEVLRLAHRILVMRGGRIVADRRGGTLNEDETLALASGGTHS
jgi:D-xylose transport system ATP-binding protein